MTKKRQELTNKMITETMKLENTTTKKKGPQKDTK